MSKVDEYRANAAECCRMAEGTKNAVEECMWRDMSVSWLAMIRHGEREDFASEERERGTKQSRSKSVH
jgi:hypothetical protein